VDEPRRFSDVQSFLDDYFDRLGAEDLTALQATARPEMLVFTVRTLKTKHLRDDVDSHRPPVAGPVWFATRAAIDYALEADTYADRKAPALLHVNGNAERDEHGAVRRDERGNPVFLRTPICLDRDYLLGPEAGHANWTGQSGLATKTSHALFLIASTFAAAEAAGTRIGALLFNVKGPDLLWLDKPSDPDETQREAYAAEDWHGLREQDRRDYEAFGFAPRPFANLRIFAPFRAGLHPGHDDAERRGGMVLSSLSAEEKKFRLNTLRNAPSENAVVCPTAVSVAELLWQAHKVFERTDLDDKFLGLIAELREERPASLAGALATLDDWAAKADDERGMWRGHNRYTILKLINRLKGLPDKFAGLLAEGELSAGTAPKPDDPFAPGEVRVVDIAGCNSRVQEVLCTLAIEGVWRRAERGELGVDKLIVFVDELNKYGPAGGGPLRDTLVDIAARGRHLNLVLFGAQQFRSKVDDEITGNCGTSFYGRVGDEEIVNPSYRSLSETTKAELLGLPKGRLLVRHAHFRAPLFGTFPLNPCLPGAVAQRVFNDGGLVRHQHPADPLAAVLKELMGEKAPPLGEVRRAADGLEPEQVQRIVGAIRERAQAPRGAGYNPWYTAKQAIANARALAW
jgi:uncharacterized protein